MAERRLAGREEELARQKEEEETKLEREVRSIVLSSLQDFFSENPIYQLAGLLTLFFSCQMIEERDRREIVEDQIAKIRSSSNTNINPNNWIQVPTAIGRANEDSGVGKGENLSAIPQGKGNDRRGID